MLGLLFPSLFVVSDPRSCERLTVPNLDTKIQNQTNITLATIEQQTNSRKVHKIQKHRTKEQHLSNNQQITNSANKIVTRAKNKIKFAQQKNDLPEFAKKHCNKYENVL